MYNIAIIGSRDLSKSSKTFQELVELVEKTIKENHSGPYNIMSGGSSWADFIAVVLKDRCFPDSNLTLYLPAEFSADRKIFMPTIGDRGAATTLNELHNQFYKQTGINSLDYMAKVKEKDNTSFIVHAGFLNRNNYIANNCDLIIALSDGINEPSSPGTLYTWNKAAGKKRIHITI
jgi:hypothetical protein